MLALDAPIETLTAEVGQLTSVSFEFPEVQDQISLDKGDLTGVVFCGSRKYTVEDGGTFLSNSDRNLILQTDNDDDAGALTAKVKITLED